MLRGFRYIAIAIGLVLLASLGQAQEQTDSAEGQTAQYQQPAQTLPIPLPVEIIEDEASADARRNKEKESQQREIDDLIAQQGMNSATQAINEATQDMRDYAFYSTLFVAAGTFLLIVTLGLTWMANRAAVKAVEVTREIGEAQTRAYVNVSSIRTVPIFDSSGKLEAFSFIPIIKNKGQTPAKILKSMTCQTNYPVDEDRFISTKFPVAMENEVNQWIGTETTFEMGVCDVPVADLDRTIRLGTSVFILGRVEYLHVFSSEDEFEISECCFVVETRGDYNTITPKTDDETIDKIITMKVYPRFRIAMGDESN